MNTIAEKIEHFNARLIPYALVVLLILIIVELFVKIENHYLETGKIITDYAIIVIFVIDLIFLAIRAKNAKFFFTNYWLDIIAVFPFAIIFGILEEFYRGIAAAERLVIGQAVLHESLEAEKIIAKESRVVRLIKIGPKMLRVITKSRLFTTFRHHRHKKDSDRKVNSTKHKKRGIIRNKIRR